MLIVLMDLLVGSLLNPLALLLLVILLTITYIWRQQHHNCGYPPGPFKFPVLGNLPQVALSGSMIEFLKNCQEKFGDAYAVEFGGHTRVVVSGYENIYQLLVKNADFTSNRHIGSLAKRAIDIAKERPGLIWAPYPHWKTMRSFTLNILRDEGMGKMALEPQIHTEISKFCEHFIEPRLGEPIDLTYDTPKATWNIISELIFGGRTEYDDPDLQTMIESFMKSIEASVVEAIVQNIPLLHNFFYSSINLTGFLQQLVQRNIDEHRKKLKPEHPQDIIDEYLSHQVRLSEQGNSDDCFTDGNLLSMAIQMYAAGTETTSTALKWALLFTTYNADVMEKVEEEINDKIGFEKDVSTIDRNRLPYIDAVLLETLRLANIVPTSVPHLLERDYVIDEKVIPAGSDLMLNMASVLHDDKVFENPEKFDPSRYLTGDMALKRRRTIPFSLGRRNCLGESLARMEFFLIYVSLVQKYRIQLAEDSSFKIRLYGRPSFINYPQSYKLIFTKRL